MALGQHTKPGRPTELLIAQAYVRGFDFVLDGRQDYCCPMCKQPWGAAPIVFVSEEFSMAMVDGHAFFVNESQARLLQVFATSFGRYMPREMIVSLAFSDASDSDEDAMTPERFSHTMTLLRKNLANTDFLIERIKGIGYCLKRKEPPKPKPRERKSNARRNKSQNSGTAPQRSSGNAKPSGKANARSKAKPRSSKSRA
jgi:DNA-binding winged helix-turn-helix (wHTH) protein